MAASIEEDLTKMNLSGVEEVVPCSVCGKEKASKKCKKRHGRCAKERIHLSIFSDS